MNDFFRAAQSICNPLASPPLGIDAHLRQEEQADDLLYAIKKLSGEMLADPQWLNTLEDAYPNLDDKLRSVRDAMLKGEQSDIEIARTELVIAYRIAAHKQAAIELERKRNDALEDAALAAYEARMGCEA